jgi:hypothetical protein
MESNVGLEVGIASQRGGSFLRSSWIELRLLSSIIREKSGREWLHILLRRLKGSRGKSVNVVATLLCRMLTNASFISVGCIVVCMGRNVFSVWFKFTEFMGTKPVMLCVNNKCRC